ncbi:regulator protein [Streptomyces sp. NBC_01622]|uniref:AfsR/SARP family transcriptional regulator n=1 Tax=Streptomyces sp. NBC_01622 TaxID=2975903 RepID=UPI003870B7C2|nr:regulator protein [Streptomyces sp. NBC_01622]
MEFKLLGPVQAGSHDCEVIISGSKISTVIASLLLARERLVGSDRMSYLLWGAQPPATRSAQIYTYISRLRKALGHDVQVERKGSGYLLRMNGSRLDVVEFEELCRTGQAELARGDYASSAESLRRALGLWRGPALTNVTSYLEDAERPRLDELRNAAHESRIEADLGLGRHRSLIPELTALVSEYPTREKLRSQLMIALYRCDRQSEAIDMFHAARRYLADELGVAPGDTLNNTYLAVLRGNVDLLMPAPSVS